MPPALRQPIAAATAPVAVRDELPLHFITCGSVDDGKSTLIGRLLWDSGAIPVDQRAALERESRSHGRAGDGNIDFSLLLDGLSSEREQGITIDVAYRYFRTERRKFIVADAPGHEQYTRNMASGASRADLAIVLVDVLRGVQPQTRRHLTIARLLGIPHVVVAVNKMDLIGWREAPFREIERDSASLATKLGIGSSIAVPVSALRGDNVFTPSAAMPWYRGPTLMRHLETVDLDRTAPQAFRFPVQWVNRPGPDFRGYSGTVRGGGIRRGDAIRVWPSRATARLQRIVTFDGDLAAARAGDAVTLALDREIDISRGDIITRDDEAPIAVADQFQASLIWVGSEPLVPGRLHLIQFSTATTTAQVTTIKFHLDVDSGAHLGARSLQFNEVGVVTLSLDRPMPIDSYGDNRHTGSFILIDRYSNATLAAGMIEFPLRRSTNVVWHELAIDKAVRAAQKDQRPLCLWLTGLSGSGKSTVANLLDKRLTVAHRHTYVLDGDNIRHGLNHDLGFTEPDRVENIRRMAEVAKLMVDAGLIVMVCAISPYRRDRDMARKLFAAGEFFEVFVDTPLSECETRDPKGLYRKARQGQIPNFTGISAPYEPPEAAEIRLDGTRPVDELVDHLLARLDLSPAAADVTPE